ncbi:MAG: Gfo/Idh/MocA family oxidoreductase [Candidatus Sumerlaeales bacterium]|nr:Gfo/Idh/MocA family oxidoreductase [Candidatus Sumerlaeales bacterium]
MMSNKNKPLEAVLLGAGGRGIYTHGAYAKEHPDQLKFVAVAELQEDRRKKFAEIHGIPESRQFASYQELFDAEKLAPMCFNTTMDLQHLDSSLMAINKGYDLFLEKPIDVTPQGVLKIFNAAVQNKCIVQICHPLRYTPFYSKIKDLIDSKAIGKVLSIIMEENVCYWHFAHSFVRGNWGVVSKSGPVILTKTCHDMDLAVWLSDSEPKSIMSMGFQLMFVKANQPEGATKRCTDGCPHVGKCPFDAISMYLTDNVEWPVSAIALDTSLEARRKALETGPYGRCAFDCDNTALDEQNVLVEFENGIQFIFGMHANTMNPTRTIRVLGTEGEIDGTLETDDINLYRFNPGFNYNVASTKVHEDEKIIESDGHHGGDSGAINQFIDLVRTRNYDKAWASLKIATDSHLLSFASEESRKQKQTVVMSEYLKTVKVN